MIRTLLNSVGDRYHFATPSHGAASQNIHIHLRSATPSSTLKVQNPTTPAPCELPSFDIGAGSGCYRNPRRGARGNECACCSWVDLELAPIIGCYVNPIVSSLPFH